jgi:hypothetical protein
MDNAVNAYLRAPADARALIDFDTRRQEALVLDRAALETTAVGATYAVESMSGRLPWCSMSTSNRLSANYASRQ